MKEKLTRLQRDSLRPNHN